MSADAKTPSAWPYWLSITFVPLVALALAKGGWWIALVPLYGWVLMPALDILLGRNLKNPDPDTPDVDLFWFRLLTWIWLPIEFALVFGGIWVITRGDYSLAETLALMFAIGVTTGTIGIVYAHELFHKPGRIERNLGDLLMAMVLYGHFRTEHLLVHHPWVGTGRDTVTARYNEGFLRFFPRVLWQGPGSAWRAEAAMLARRGLPGWHWRNPIWKIPGPANRVSGTGLCDRRLDRGGALRLSGAGRGLATGTDQLCRALWPDPEISGRGAV